MKNIFKSVKGKVLVGALAFGVIGGGVASASGFGFIQQLANILSGATDKAAAVSAGAVSEGDKNGKYKEQIVNDVNSATNSVASQLATDAMTKITAGNKSVKDHYDQLKADINTTAADAVSTGKTKITNAVNAKVSSVNSSVEDAAVAAINSQLTNPGVKYFTGGQVVNK